LLRTCLLIALIASALAGCVFVRPSAAAPPQKDSRSTIRLLSAALPESSETPAPDANPFSQPEYPSDYIESDTALESVDQPRSFTQPPLQLEDVTGPTFNSDPNCDGESFFSRMKWLGLRHSSADGRNAGLGVPLVGTSWLNRPYYIGADLGAIWITDGVTENISRDLDFYGGIFAGYDWDYYWGSELAVHRATPELKNEVARDARRGDRMLLWTASMLYYPWGDSMYRPYWRVGIGAMEIDYPTDSGSRRDEALWMFPIGIGIKYPFNRWLIGRAEFADQLGLGNSNVSTQHDLTLTFGLEWRYGAHSRSYWPWNPDRHIW